MTEEEFRKELRDNDLNTRKACDLVFIKTEAVIKPKHIETMFERQGRLSEPLTACFRFLFGGLNGRKI